MPINSAAVGTTLGPIERSWTPRDTMLYALGVGAGSADPEAELDLTTENSEGVTQRVLPSFASVIASVDVGTDFPELGSFDPAMQVHGEQAVTIHRPIPPRGRIRTFSTITGIFDKGSGALVVTETRSEDSDTAAPMFTTNSSVFVRGEGNFGGDRGRSTRRAIPNRGPDLTASYATRPDQALLYRLCGDRHPLHSDPVVARRVGFTRPILQGLCTFGITTRALTHQIAGGDPTRITSVSGRFTNPVLPGDTLTVSTWGSSDGDVAFRTTTDDGTTVIDDGWCRVADTGMR